MPAKKVPAHGWLPPDQHDQVPDTSIRHVSGVCTQGNGVQELERHVGRGLRRGRAGPPARGPEGDELQDLASESKTRAVLDNDNDDTPRLGLSPATKSATVIIDHEIPSIDSTLSAKDIDEDLGADGFFFQEALSATEQAQTPARYSPPSKRSNVDKWAALGERRRRTRVPRLRKSVGVAIHFERKDTTGLDFFRDLRARATESL